MKFSTIGLLFLISVSSVSAYADVRFSFKKETANISGYDGRFASGRAHDKITEVVVDCGDGNKNIFEIRYCRNCGDNAYPVRVNIRPKTCLAIADLLLAAETPYKSINFIFDETSNTIKKLDINL